MRKFSGRYIERFAPHDLRRTARSNTNRLRVDFEMAEAMLNHARRGLERTYDRYELEDEKRVWFLRWEAEMAKITCDAGVAGMLGIPEASQPIN